MEHHVLARDDGKTPVGTPSGVYDLGPYLNRVIWVLAGLSGLFLGLRLYCKRLRRKQLWWDDYFLMASWVRPHDPKTPFCIRGIV